MKQINQMEQAKQIYEQIEIPAELSKRVAETIGQHDAKRRKVIMLRKRNILIQRTAACAAVLLLIFTLSVNTSTAFAKAISGVPILGSIASLVTFRSYTNETDELKLSVEIPSLEIIAEDTNGLAEAVNQEIHTLCEQYAQGAVERAHAYKDAFIATGGTEEEWAAHNLTCEVGYEIKSQTDRYLSFTIWGNENWSSANDTVSYYTMDLASQSLVTLKDLLGEDYIAIANKCIREQMKEMEKEGITFFSMDNGGFTGITPDSSFYLNQEGNPVIVFAKYEIAPGAYGSMEFEITSRQGSADEPASSGKDSAAVDNSAENYYTDNFAVDQETVKAFAAKIKQAVAEQDLEALADLAGYPLYFGKPDESINIMTKEDFIALGSDAVFTTELTEAISAADENSLSPSMAGFVLRKDGKPNIVFGVSEGKLGIRGINY